MIELLNSISEKQNLWKIAESNALKCIENYISESIELDYPMLRNVVKNDFVLTKHSQSLIFWNNGNQSYVLRTHLNVNLENEIEIINGYYLLDVDENGNLIDEWFVLKNK